MAHGHSETLVPVTPAGVKLNNGEILTLNRARQIRDETLQIRGDVRDILVDVMNGALYTTRRDGKLQLIPGNILIEKEARILANKRLWPLSHK